MKWPCQEKQKKLLRFPDHQPRWVKYYKHSKVNTKKPVNQILGRQQVNVMEEENGTWRREYRKRKTPCITPMRGGNQEASKDQKSSKHPLSQHWSNAKTSKEILASAEENDKRNTRGLKQQTTQKISPYLLRTPILLFASIWIELTVELRMRYRWVSDLTIY